MKVRQPNQLGVGSRSGAPQKNVNGSPTIGGFVARDLEEVELESGLVGFEVKAARVCLKKTRWVRYAGVAHQTKAHLSLMRVSTNILRTRDISMCW